jgi:hypothetical protein
MKGDNKAQERLKYKLQSENPRITRHQCLTSSRNKPADKGRGKEKIATNRSSDGDWFQRRPAQTGYPK